MNKEEIEKALKLFDREDLIDDVIEDLDTDIGVFMTVNQMIYYSKLQQENKQLKDNWNKLKKHIQECLNEALENDVYDRTSYEQGIISGLESSLFKLEELEKGDSNE